MIKSYRALLQYTNHSYISYSIFFTDLSLPLPACLSWCTPNLFFWHTDAHVPSPSSVHSPPPLLVHWCTHSDVHLLLPLDVHFLPPSDVPMYTWRTLSPSWCDSDVYFLFHSHGLKRGGVFCHWVCFSSGWSLIRVFSHQGGPSSGWSSIRVVSHLGALCSLVARLLTDQNHHQSKATQQVATSTQQQI